MTPRPRVRPARCRHVRPTGSRCYGWAAKGGLCPAHAGRNARLGGRRKGAA